jgi:hypothetical protein
MPVWRDHIIAGGSVVRGLGHAAARLCGHQLGFDLLSRYQHRIELRVWDVVELAVHTS